MDNNDNQNLNILDEVNKVASMGINAITYIFPKVKDRDFKKVLNVERNKYEKISERVDDLYSNYIKRLNTFIEPVMIVFLAIIVGTVVLAVVIPMFSFYSQIA